MVGVILFDVFNRYFFSSGSIALQELEWHLFDIVMLISISLTMQNDRHVRVDIFYSHLNKKQQDYLNIFSYIFFILPFSLLIIIKSLPFIIESFSQNEISSDPGGLPHRYLIKSLIIIGFFLLIIQSIKSLINIIKNLKINTKA